MGIEGFSHKLLGDMSMTGCDFVDFELTCLGPFGKFKNDTPKQWKDVEARVKEALDGQRGSGCCFLGSGAFCARYQKARVTAGAAEEACKIDAEVVDPDPKVCLSFPLAGLLLTLFFKGRQRSCRPRLLLPGGPCD